MDWKDLGVSVAIGLPVLVFAAFIGVSIGTLIKSGMGC